MNKAYGCSLPKPMVAMLSGALFGQEIASTVEISKDKLAAPSKIGAGLVVQKKSRPVLAENRVRKSDIETFG